MKTLILFFTFCMWIASASLYVNPANIQAISFPAMRISLENGAAVPDELHILCEWDSNDFCASQNATYVNEHRMKCFTNDETKMVRNAIVNCSYIPSKDERVNITDTIEQDSCFVTASVEPYVATATEKQHPLWVPRSSEKVVSEERIKCPEHAQYEKRMKIYHDALSKRQIVQYSFGQTYRTLCNGGTHKLKNVQANLKILHEMDKEELDYAIAYVVMIVSAVIGSLVFCCNFSILGVMFKMIRFIFLFLLIACVVALVLTIARETILSLPH